MEIGVLTLFIWFVCLKQEYSQSVAVLSYHAAFCALAEYCLFIPFKCAPMRFIL
jgi:hypothetical protein